MELTCKECGGEVEVTELEYSCHACKICSLTEQGEAHFESAAKKMNMTYEKLWDICTRRKNERPSS